MLTNVASTSTPRARALQARTSTSTALKIRPRQQCRGFRFGLWSSQFNPDLQREIRRRHKVLRSKYAESLNRKLAWDQNPLAEESRELVKRLMGGCWSVRYSTHFKPTEKDKDKPRDATREAESQSNSSAFWNDYDVFRSQMYDVMNQWAKSPAFATKSTGSNAFTPASFRSKRKYSQIRESASGDADYVIDPITNRKVPKKTYGTFEDVDVQAKEFKPYTPPVETSDTLKAARDTPPVHSDGLPPVGELHQYRQVNAEESPINTSDIEINKLDPEVAADVKAYQDPVIHIDEYSLNHLPVEDSAETYEDLDKYTAVMHNEPDGKVTDPLQQYNDLHQYNKPYTHSEPDGVIPEAQQQYKDLSKYKPYLHDEAQAQTQESIEQYEDLDKYKPYMYQENPNAEESTTAYKDLDQYKPYKFQEDQLPEVLESKYEDLDQYNKAYMYKEKERAEQSEPAYEDLNDYNKPYMYKESQAADNSEPAYEDLKTYDKPYMYKENEDQEGAESSYEDLDTYDKPFSHKENVRWETSLGPASTGSDQPFQQYGDLDQYKAFRYQEPDGRRPLEQDGTISSLDEFDAAQAPAHSKENKSTGFVASPSAKRQLSTISLDRDFLDRSMLQFQEASDVIDQKARSNIKILRKRAREHQKVPITPQLTGNYTRDFPEDFARTWTLDETSALKPNSQQVSSAARTSSISWENKPQNTKGTRLQTSLDRQNSSRKRSTLNRQSKRQVEVDPYSKHPLGLETSYTEECGGKPTWPTFVRTYGDLGSAAAVQSSKTGTEPMKGTENAAAAKEIEPTVYMVLAYDPTSQKVDIAETTSIVSDQATPLTPVEALLRLSNPTKFLPHFARLQRQGFEIVSGSGDILVFRKVRSVESAQKHESFAERAAATVKQYQEAAKVSKPVNPVDMMGREAIPYLNPASFASPTGFVNYDIPNVASEPAFRSNIDVRREEPVYSGPKSSIQDKPKRGIFRKALVGGAWVAGVSYALGVVLDYFKTGGNDGKGPRRL